MLVAARNTVSFHNVVRQRSSKPELPPKVRIPTQPKPSKLARNLPQKSTFPQFARKDTPSSLSSRLFETPVTHLTPSSPRGMYRSARGQCVYYHYTPRTRRRAAKLFPSPATWKDRASSADPCMYTRDTFFHREPETRGRRLVFALLLRATHANRVARARCSLDWPELKRAATAILALRRKRKVERSVIRGARRPGWFEPPRRFALKNTRGPMPRCSFSVDCSVGLVWGSFGTTFLWLLGLFCHCGK